MTRPVLRTDVLDARSYEGHRPAFREEVLLAKARRRIHLGDFFTFLFENTLTIRYQIQEMLRAEHITDEAAIRHELDTYNGLLGGTGELGCTLLIEIDDPVLRAARLREWFALPEHVYVRRPDGTKVGATFDESQRGEGRLSSVPQVPRRTCGAGRGGHRAARPDRRDSVDAGSASRLHRGSRVAASTAAKLC